ncbi:CaiB/BaiF CoA transferase family protein [Caldimonas sp. KR1-144]|uniref:CaiB/BaiF CoA transferase family protein n=1 Tax=Caldimonas sp. KR1-144 TaxID=3400911 RepID=UPI003C03AA95
MTTSPWTDAWERARPIATDWSSPPPQAPLASLRILDLSRLLPGPMACRYLADLGAQVLKIEPPMAGGTPGDDAAGMGPRHGETSAFYQVVNAGKRRLALDLKRESDLASLRALVAEAHAVVEGFRPGVMERLGLGYAALAAINPRIVLASISGYGQDGPLRLAAGHDINYLSLAGVIDQTRAADGTPAICHLQIADLLGGAQSAAIGTLAGIVGGLTRGRGGWVDVSMTDAVRQHLVFAGIDALLADPAPAPGASLLDGGVACYQLYRCADGAWLAVGALELKFWQALCDALGQAAWRSRHWSLGEAPGSAAARQLIGEVAAHFAAAPRDAWLARLAAADCCVTPVLDAATALFGAGGADAGEGLRRLAGPALRWRS